MSKHQGQCLCGKVQFSIEIEKKEAGACYCEICRRWTGGILVMHHGTIAPEVKEGSALGVYRSSDWGERCFCQECGSNLFWRAADGSFFGVSVDALADSEGFVLGSEVFTDHKPAYYKPTEHTAYKTAAEFWEMVQAHNAD